MPKLITGLAFTVLAAALAAAVPAHADPTPVPGPYVIQGRLADCRRSTQLAADLRGTAEGLRRRLGSKLGNLGLPAGNKRP
jgi:hypothetical protein